MLKREDVIKVAALAKIQLSEEEIEVFSKQLPEIIAFVEKLEELDTSDIPPFYELLELPAPLRKDEPKPGLTQEEALANAPEKKDGFFVVPRVVKAE